MAQIIAVLAIAKNILGVATALLGLSDKLIEARGKRRAAIADLFERISNTLLTVSGEIRRGKQPDGACSAIITYANELPKTISKEVGDKKANELAQTLHSNYRVEQFAVGLRKKADKERYLKQIDEASGKFRALAYLVRAR